MKGLFKRYLSCNLCPRNCKINRIIGKKGFCGEGSMPRVAYVGPHFGEEPPITGRNGSGTVFFTGCSLKCSFCQNWQISHEGMGKRISIRDLVQKIEQMIRRYRVHNINFVTPDHFMPHVILVIYVLKKKGLNIPFLLNTSGYQSAGVLKEIEDYVDIYLPDFKYADKKLATQLSSCSDYTDVALDAISEMIRQKGFLEIEDSIAKRGVLVRHLILPGKVKNSIDTLSILYGEFGKDLPISLMSQYNPVLSQKDPSLNRMLKEEEFFQVYNHAFDLGFSNIFAQFPREMEENKGFIPDFRFDQPFRGNENKMV